MVCELLFPVTTLRKLTLEGVAESCGSMPVPLSAIPSGDPTALLVIEMLPVTAPAEAGLNVAEKVAFWPALMVKGVESPEIAKPTPETLAAEIVTLVVPELVRVTDCDPLLPTRTLPKLTLAGLAVSCP
jgi:hypothetical protein